MNRPNVVLICADQWRGDCLSGAGHPVVRTPHLDALAARGARFDRAYSATPSCIPARAALMTGAAQDTHGRVGYEEGVPWSYPVTLAREFGRHGYQTHAVGKMHVHPERERLGFDEVVLHDGYLSCSRAGTRRAELYDDYLPWLRQQSQDAAADYFAHGVDCNSVVARPWDKAESLHPTSWITSMGLRFLDRRDPGSPFLLMLSYHRPHPPYDPPAWAFQEFLDREIDEPVIGDWTQVWEHHRQDHRPDAYVAHYDAETVRRARAAYYASIRHVDLQLNRFLTGLVEHGLADDTWVLFTSDHGEMLGDHHMYRKAYPYEGSARVPLVLAGPGSKPGVVCDDVVELRDVLPTLLDCAGLAVPDSVDGRSLLPLAQGGPHPVREWLHGEHELLGESFQWVVDDRWKYIWLSGSGREQLFDLRKDPRETRDLVATPAGESAAVLERLRARLVGALDGRPEDYVAGGELVPGRPPLRVLPGVLDTATPVRA